MRTKNLIFFIFILGISIKAQEKDTLQYTNLNASQSAINQDIMIDYLVKRKELILENEINKYENLVITEVYGGVDVSDGICLFTSISSHSKQYIFLETINGVRILNFNSINKNLQEILLFAEEKKLNDFEQLKLVKRVIELFERYKRVKVF